MRQYKSAFGAIATGKRWTRGASVDSIGEYDYCFALSNGSTVAIYGDNAQTGDSSHIVLWTMMMLLSAAAALAGLFQRRKIME